MVNFGDDRNDSQIVGISNAPNDSVAVELEGDETEGKQFIGPNRIANDGIESQFVRSRAEVGTRTSVGSDQMMLEQLRGTVARGFSRNGGKWETVVGTLFRFIEFGESDTSGIEGRFNALITKWKSETAHLSSTDKIVMHEAYQQIIGMGPKVLPLIFRELQSNAGHWFWALRSITGENPVPAQHLGRMKLMANDWLDWGRERGFL